MWNDLISKEATLGNNLQISLNHNIDFLVLGFNHEVYYLFDLHYLWRIELPRKFKRFVTIYEFYFGVAVFVWALEFYLDVVDEKLVGFQ